MSEVICLRHFGLVVRDLGKELEFYEGLLGLRPGPAVLEEGPFLDTILGAEGVRVTTVKMRAEEGETLLELLNFINPPVAGSAALPFHQRGPTHIALTVKDLPALAAKLDAAGCEVLSPPRPSPDGKVLAAFCRDFEGNLVELVQPAAVGVDPPDCKAAEPASSDHWPPA